MLSARNTNRLQNMCYLLFFWLCIPKLWTEFELWFEKKKEEEEKEDLCVMTCGMNNLEIN